MKFRLSVDEHSITHIFLDNIEIDNIVTSVTTINRVGILPRVELSLSPSCISLDLEKPEIWVTVGGKKYKLKE